MTAEELVFLDVDDVIELHAMQLELFGGGAGLRDRALLESAVAQPSDALYELTMGVAEGRVGKPAVAVELERIAKRNAL